MTPDEVRRAVVEPARIAGCEVDNELVEVLIRDLTPHGAPPANWTPAPYRCCRTR